MPATPTKPDDNHWAINQSLVAYAVHKHGPGAKTYLETNSSNQIAADWLRDMKKFCENTMNPFSVQEITTLYQMGELPPVDASDHHNPFV